MTIEFHEQNFSHNFGTRIATAELRESLKLSETFEGLPETVNRYDLLVLVKRAGAAAGFTPRLIQLLDYYMAFTRECDWEEGSAPIVYQSVTRTAMELGICERQVRRMEHRLFQLGALTWCDSGNHRRYGQRDPKSGQLIYAFGVDLTPLATLADDLSMIVEQRAAERNAWHAIKRQITWYRGQIRAELAARMVEAEQTPLQSRFEAISEPLRTSMSISRMECLLDAHKALLADLRPVDNSGELRCVTPKESAKGDKNVRHIEYTNQLPLSEENSSPPDRGLQERQGDTSETIQEPPEITDSETRILSTGLQHITLKQALNAASDSFRDYIPREPRPMSWADLVEAANTRRRQLRISQTRWAAACELLGRNGAAIAVLIVDRAAERSQDPVRIPAAYFSAMLERARSGNLHLQASVFACLKREDKVTLPAAIPARTPGDQCGRIDA